MTAMIARSMSTTSTDVSTRPPMVTAGTSGGRGPQPGARWWVAVVAAVLLVAFVVGAAFLPVPYVALRPGKVRPVLDQVLVEGAATYEPQGSVAYTTVNVGQATLLEAFVGWLDDDVDVRPEEVIRDGRSADENRRYNAELMDASKTIAVAVALRQLGEEVPVRTSGAIVRVIGEGTPADGVLELDDVIVAVDGQPVDEADEIGELLQSGGPGAAHSLTVERPPGSGETLELDVTTVESPDDPARAIIGVAPEDRIVAFELPYDVFIDSGEVGGPSAGLAFTLAVIDLLSPGELTGGLRVAVTGTIALDGTVGPVGGPAQKAVTVRAAGYDAFLVPTLEVDEVRAAVGDDLRVIPVGNLAEALEALESLGGDVGAVTG